MSAFISMPLFNEAPQISLPAIQKYLSSHWSDVPSLGLGEDANGEGHAHTFTIGDDMGAIGIMSVPIPWTELEGPCETSVFWPNATKEVREHSNHLIISVFSQTLPPIEQAGLLTKLTASVMATTSGCTGVYWGDARMVLPRELFVDFATKVLPEEPPMHIWVDFRVGQDEGGGSNGFTVGLASLGLMEIEATQVPEIPGMLHNRLTGLAEYLLTSGLVIKDGDTIGRDDNEKITVKYEVSQFGHEGKVLSLKYAGAKVKKSRFKFWGK